MRSRAWLLFGTVGCTGVILASLALTTRPIPVMVLIGIVFGGIGAVTGRIERMRSVTQMQEAQLEGERPKWGWITSATILVGLAMSKLNALPALHDFGVPAFFGFFTGYFGYIATRNDLIAYMDELGERVQRRGDQRR